MNHDQLLQQFSLHIGAKNMAFDHQRSCILNFEDRYVISINEINKESLLLTATIGQLSEQQANEHALQLLNLNMKFASIGGPYVTYEASNRILLLATPLITENLDAIGLEAQIKYLMQSVDLLHNNLEQKNIQLIIQ